MNCDKLNIVYFSAKGTTARVITAIADGMQPLSIDRFDITNRPIDGPPVELGADSVTVFGVPVYSGRVPQVALQGIRKFSAQHGNNGVCPAIIVCVYGNREFDDALLELKEVVELSGFRVVAAAAFVAEHSIFPAVATGRPDQQDMRKIAEFGVSCRDKIEHLKFSLNTGHDIIVPGNNPYRAVGRIPLKPQGSRRCNECLKCVAGCPVRAIEHETPRRTNKELCISCGHCIAVCPQKARGYSGLMYALVSRKFSKMCATRKEPVVFL